MDTAALDRAGTWRFDELADLPDDDRRYEVVDGLLVVSPPPSQAHQLLSNWLQRQLLAQAPDEWDVIGEFALPLGTDGRVPDLSVIRRSRLPAKEAGPYPYGPECFGLVVEVVSSTSRKTDRFAKPGEYAEAGIPLLWRVETDPEIVVLAFGLAAGTYVGAGEVRRRGTLPVPWGEAQVDVDRLRGLPEGKA